MRAGRPFHVTPHRRITPVPYDCWSLTDWRIPIFKHADSGAGRRKAAEQEGSAHGGGGMRTKIIACGTQGSGVGSDGRLAFFVREDDPRANYAEAC